MSSCIFRSDVADSICPKCQTNVKQYGKVSCACVMQFLKRCSKWVNELVCRWNKSCGFFIDLGNSSWAGNKVVKAVCTLLAKELTSYHCYCSLILRISMCKLPASPPEHIVVIIIIIIAFSCSHASVKYAMLWQHLSAANVSVVLCQRTSGAHQ